MTITVPIPDPCLSPNARAHWAKRCKAKNAAKDHVAAAMFGAGPAPTAPLVMHVRWFARTSHAMDDDNCWARMKGSRDQIAKSLGIDDRNIRQGTMTFAKDAKNPRLEITLESQ